MKQTYNLEGPQRQKWLDGLRPGDLVEIWGARNWAINGYSASKVRRTTKTLIVLENGRRYRKRDGQPTRTQPHDQGFYFLVPARD